MSDIDLVRKYIHRVSCGHCGGSGVCECDRCKTGRHGGVMAAWEMIHGRPLPTEVELGEEYRKNRREESDRQRERLEKESVCYPCSGKGVVEKCNYELLDRQVQRGEILENEMYAILKELGRMVPRTAFDRNE